RNPIAAMRLKSENALASPDSDRKDAALDAILRQVARLDRLLRDLLEMTQAREPRPEATDLTSFLQSTVEGHRELASSKGVSLTIGTCEASSPLPRFDAFQMQRALDNLIINAIQNTPDAGKVVVDALRREDRLVLRV